MHEPHVASALEYVRLAERTNGQIPRRVDYAYVWGEALNELQRRQPHARIINLETAIATSESAEPKTIHYRTHPGNAPVLGTAGIDCCVLANNHVLDWGTAGLLETVASLRRSGVGCAGAGTDSANARCPCTLPLRGRGRILVFAFGAGDSGIPATWAATVQSPGVHRIPDFSDETIDDIATLVAASKRRGDIAVASIHWGGNWGYGIRPEHRRFAHGLIDRAAIDVVHGHSSHHAKAIELYADRLILYGCGDFIDDYEGISGYERFRDDLVLMYFPVVAAHTGRLVRLEMTPLQVRRFRLDRPSPEDRAWIRDTLDRECRRFGHRVEQHDEVLVLA